MKILIDIFKGKENWLARMIEPRWKQRNRHIQINRITEIIGRSQWRERSLWTVLIVYGVDVDRRRAANGGRIVIEYNCGRCPDRIDGK